MAEERHIAIDAEALAGRRFPYQEDIALVGTYQTDQDIERGCFAGAIRP